MGSDDITTDIESVPEDSGDTKPIDKVSKELAGIRKRRNTDSKNRFPSAIEDWTLLAGLGYGALYAMLLFGMSSGVFGESTSLDHWASDTFLDSGDQCEEVLDTPWIHAYPDNDVESVKISGRNLAEGIVVLNWSVSASDGGIEPLPSQGEVNKKNLKIDYAAWEIGTYELVITIDLYVPGTDMDNRTEEDRVNGTERIDKTLEFEISTSENALSFLPFIDSEVKREAHILEDGPRSCWSVTDLGNWGFVLMGAELGGGRETAMLTGGAAGIPAWWMAFVSLSLSVISLFLAYPVMYKLYHQDTDDMLSRTHIRKVVVDVLRNAESRMHIDIDWDLYKIEVRDLSIDIMIPYSNTEGTFSDSADVRSEILKEILEEFALFRVFKPVQLTVRSIGDNQAIDFETGVGVGSGMVDDQDVEDQDYTAFFRDLHMLSKVEDDVRESVKGYFRSNNNLDLQMATVTSEDSIIFVRVAYKPNQRFAFFRFKDSNSDIEKNLRKYISRENPELVGTQELIVKGRNLVSTLADRSGAGRVETLSSKDSEDARVAAVAKQDGLGGRVLQTKLFGDILSTVEYTANEKREMINKWGFWGLIVFVWIPFMASGVLVGAMLGLLSRMKFIRVLWATFFGGAAASLTWAYTAEGIITVMHKYKLEAAIPIAIIAFIAMAFLHMRSTKIRRQAELFEDTLLDSFHADIRDKYGNQ
ncbi:MAG: small multi-drug export protein [Candidatus Poseidoniaceae archaeon]|nr:small multi-drug export protein [Candidatus Poseidoniaceae archaeon]